MKKIRGYILFFLLLVVLVFIILRQDRWSSTTTAERAYSILSSERITSIVITDPGGGGVTLSRKNGKWVVNSRHDVRDRAVDMILKTLERVRVVALVSSDKQDYLPDRIKKESVKVDIYKPGRTRSFFVYSEGIDSPTYMYHEGAGDISLVEAIGFRGHLASLFTTDEGFWRSNVLFSHHPDSIETVIVDHRDDPERSFMLKREDGRRAKLYEYPSGTSGKEVNDSLLIRYFANFYYVPFERYANSEERQIKDSLLISAADYYIKLVSRDKYTEEVYLHRIIAPASARNEPQGFDPFRLHAIVNNRNDMVVIPYHSLDLILRSYSHFY